MSPKEEIRIQFSNYYPMQLSRNELKGAKQRERVKLNRSSRDPCKKGWRNFLRVSKRSGDE